MADKEVKVTIKAVDEATKTISSIAKEIQALANGTGSVAKLGKQFKKLGTIFTGLKSSKVMAVAMISAVIKGYDKLYQASKRNFTQGLQGILNICGKVVQALQGAFSGFMGLVTEVTGQDLSFTGLMNSAIEYEQQMRKVEVITGATTEQFAELEKKSIELGKNTPFTSGEIASAMVNMAQQGLEVGEILDNIGSATALAVVGEMEMADASYLLTSSLNQFKTTSEDAERFANVMTNTFLNSGATVSDFGESLKYCGNIAGQMNIPIEQIGTAIGILGDNVQRKL